MGKQLQQLILTRFFQHLMTNFKYSVTKKMQLWFFNGLWPKKISLVHQGEWKSVLSAIELREQIESFNIHPLMCTPVLIIIS